MSAKQAGICKNFPFKNNKASFCFIQQIPIHTKAVLNLEGSISPPRKISCEIGDVAECGSQIEIKFHERLKLRSQDKIKLCKLAITWIITDKHWDMLSYPSCLAEKCW